MPTCPHKLQLELLKRIQALKVKKAAIATGGGSVAHTMPATEASLKHLSSSASLCLPELAASGAAMPYTCPERKATAAISRSVSGNISSTTAPLAKKRKVDVSSWECPKCNNNNRSHRKECFRCRFDKPTFGPVPTKPAAAPPAEASPFPKAIANTDNSVVSTASTTIAMNKGTAVRTKDWAPQATNETINENNALRELASRVDRDTSAEWLALVSGMGACSCAHEYVCVQDAQFLICATRAFANTYRHYLYLNLQ